MLDFSVEIAKLFKDISSNSGGAEEELHRNFSLAYDFTIFIF
jgi:hypothetical protein